MKGKFKAIIALALILILFPLALLMTIAHWLPTLAGIWLPQGTQLPWNPAHDLRVVR